jgi:polar amino acid transport system permease protein
VYRKKTKITAVDLILMALILAVLAYIVYRLTVKLNYRWNWPAIPRYLVYYSAEHKGWMSGILLKGLYTTIRLSVWATLMAAVLGLVTGIMRATGGLFSRLIGRTYVELIRNVPPLVLIFIFYFFFSGQIMPLLGVEDFIRSRTPETQRWLAVFFATPDVFTAFLSGTITVAVFQGAYITEIVRAGIQSIERGQGEAAYALGLSWPQQMRDVVLPQALRRILPALANEFINTIKYSAIVSVISIQELTFQGMQIMASTQMTIEVWLVITAMYLVLCLVLSVGVQWLEQHMARSDA